MAKFKPITEQAFEKATNRGMRFGPLKALTARFDRKTSRLTIRMNSGLDVSFSSNQAPSLEHASVEQLSDVEVTGSGWTLHFPKLDADFSISRLLVDFLGTTDWVKRESQLNASRANGKLGGRPRKDRSAA
ncbi:MAG: DUF2442 domain-containing protein [Micropepsaceae bacterium]